MGRIAHERHIHFNYFPEFIEHWKLQTDEFKQLCEDIGKPYGYSAMNIFYIFFIQYWTHEESGVPRKYYKSAL